GLAKAAKKAVRAASDGAVGSYIHAGGKIGVLVEVNCETDFVAKTTEFQQLVRDLGMQVAATRPRWVSREDVPATVLDSERAIYKEQARQQGKPDKILDRIVEGQVERFYKDVCLLDQPFIKESDRTVGDVVRDAVVRLGENVTVRRFTRFQLGETLDASPDNKESRTGGAS